VVKERLDAILHDRVQQIRDSGQVLLPENGKLGHQLRSPANVREVLVAGGKGQPVVARKGDACSGRGGSTITLERKVRRPWLGLHGRNEARDEALLRSRPVAETPP